MGTIQVEIEGAAPLLMHNGRLANPLDKYAVAMKKVTAKRQKTEDDYIEIMRLEFLGGLYHHKDHGVYIPAANIESALFDGGKVKKRGQMIKQGVSVVNDINPLRYDGPRDPDALWSDDVFRDVRRVRLSKTSSMMRCRPIFRAWRLAFALVYFPDVIDPSYIREALDDAGRRIGLGDYHMRFGKFTVTQWREA